MPYLGFDPLEPLGLPALRAATEQRRRRRKSDVEPMTEEEETSLLSGFLGMLGFLGETLDKPRAAVQGLLAGRPEQLWNLVPFSDTLGITDETGYFADTLNQIKHDDRVYGRDLLQSWGIAPENVEGFHPIDNPQDALWDALGLGVEVVGDPLIAVRGPMGALTSKGLSVAKGAKFAEGAAGLDELVEHALKVGQGTQTMGRIMGTTPKAIANEIRAGERGLAAIRLPFAKEPLAVFGAGSEPAARFVEGLYYNKFNPMVPLRAAFSKKVGGIWDPIEQAARDEQLGKLINYDAMVRVAGETFQDRLPQLESLWKDIGGQTGYEGADEMVRYIAEMRDFTGNKIPIARQDIAAMFDNGPAAKIDEFAEQVHPLVNAYMKIKDMAWAKHKELGGIGEWLDATYPNHFPRGVHKPYKESFDKLMRQYLLPTGTPNASRRNPIFDLPGGTITVNRLSRDRLLSGTKDIPKEDLKAALLSQLDVWDPANAAYANMSLENIQAWYAYHRYLKPEEEKMLARGMDPTELAAKRHKLLYGLVDSVPGTDAVPGKASTIRSPLPSEAASAGSGGFTVGQKVHAADRDNYGTIIGISGNNARVHFKSPEGATATVSLPLDSLSPLRQPAQKATENAGVSAAARSAKYADAAEQPILPQLIAYLSKLPEEVRETGLFNRTTFQDWMDYNEHLAVSIANLSTIHNILQQAISKEPGGDDWITLRQAIQGVTSPNGKRRMTDDGILYAVKKYFGQDPQNSPLNSIDPKYLLGGTFDELGSPIPGMADELWVDPRTPAAINKYFDIQTKQGQSFLGHLYDQYQAMFAFGVTLPWPAFSARNRADGFWRNICRIGADTYSMGELANAEKNLAKLRWGRGTSISDLPHIREFQDAGILEGQKMADVAAAIGAELEELPTSLWEVFRAPTRTGYYADQSWWDVFNPLNVNKVRASEKAGRQNVVAEVGKRAHQWVEFANRYAPFAAAMDHGLDAAQARKLVLDIQFDYSRLKGGAIQGNLGDTIARKVFPFWSFMQNNIPYQIGQLLNYPGGGHAQTLRFINRAHQSNSEYLPEWLSERTAIRIPSDDDEKARFIRQFGLSIEDLTRFNPHILTGRGVKRTTSRLLSEMGPVLTLPIKLFSGEDIYSGRPLKELEGVTGIPLLDTALMSTPASRAINTTEMFLDERSGPWLKALNFLTGAKVGTYDLEKARLYDLAKANEAVIAQAPQAREFTEIYVPKAKRDQITPQTERALRLNAQIRKRIKELNEKRAKAAAI